MLQEENKLYEFGDYSLDAAEHALYKNGELISLTPKALETLLVLVRDAGHVVSKEKLLEEVWPDSFVEEGNLNVNIFALRKALGDASQGRSYIETVPRRGFLFAAPVHIASRRNGPVIIETRTQARFITEEISEVPAVPEIDAVPKPAQLPVASRISRWLWVCAAVLALALLAGGAYLFAQRPGAPVRVSLADKKLIAWDAKNRVSWEYDFPQPAEFQAVQGQSYALFSDLLGDGRRELLALVNLRAENPAVGEIGGDRPNGYNRSFLYCFSEKGRLLWSYSPDFQLSFAGHVFEGPWPATAMTLTPAAKGQTIWIAYRHHTWWPSFVTRIDAHGAASLAFVNSGHLWFLASVRNSTGDYVLVGGINNDLESAILAVLGDNEQVSASPQPLSRGSYAYDNFLRAPHLYFIFSPSEVFRLSEAAYHTIQSIVVETDRIQVHTYEGTQPTSIAHYLQGYYEFTKDFELKSASLGDLYWQAHRLYESQGKIHHSAEQCPDRSIGSRLREYTGAGGWLAPNVPPEHPAN